MTIEIRNARFSYADLRQPTREELHDGRHSVSITIPNPPHVQAAFALAFGYNPTRFLVGHDPQKLLPAPDKQRTFRERLEVWRQGGDLAAHGLKLPDRRRHPLAPHDLDHIEAASEEPLIPPREKTPWGHKIAIVPVGDMTAALMLSLQAREDVRAIVIDIESASGHLRSALGQIDIMGRFREASDNAQLRLYALGAMLGEPYMPRLEKIKPKIVSTSAGKRDMSYLAHDPSKKHKRRKRR